MTQDMGYQPDKILAHCERMLAEGTKEYPFFVECVAALCRRLVDAENRLGVDVEPASIAACHRKTLTPKQEKVYRFLCDYLAANRYPPTMREIMDEFGIASTNGVECHLKALEKKGWVTREGKRARTIRPVNGREKQS